jgi:pilus assembly protein CpaF
MEVVGLEGDSVKLQSIFEFVKKGVSPEGRILGEFRATGYIPSFIREALAQGIKLDVSMFESKFDDEANVKVAAWS